MRLIFDKETLGQRDIMTMRTIYNEILDFVLSYYLIVLSFFCPCVLNCNFLSRKTLCYFFVKFRSLIKYCYICLN